MYRPSYTSSGQPGNPVNPAQYQGGYPPPAYQDIQEIERNAVRHYDRKHLRRFGNGLGFSMLGMLALSLLVMLIFMMLGMFVFDMAVDATGSSLFTDDVVNQLVQFIAYSVSIIVPFALLGKLSGYRVSNLVPLSRPAKGLFWPAFFIGLAVCILGNFATDLLAQIMGIFHLETNMPETTLPAGLVGNILLLFNMSVMPALLEEFAFRGVVMQPLRKYGDGFAIMMSAATFGLLHGNLLQAPFAFVVGLGIGYFVIRTGSMWVGVAIHFANNFLATLLSIILEGQSEQTFFLVSGVYYLIPLIFGLIALCLFLKRDRSAFALHPSSSVLTRKERVNAFLGNPGMILAIIALLITSLFFVKAK